MTNTEMLSVLPALRLTPENAGRWKVHDLDAKTAVLTTPAVVAVVLSFCGGRSREDARSLLIAEYGLDPENVDRTIDEGVQRGWLVSAEDLETSVADGWRAAGWRRAHEHHVATFDYPYEDYKANGRERDIALMRSYYAEAADTRRYKSSGGVAIALPTANDALQGIETPLSRAVTGTVSSSVIDKDMISTVMAGAFGPLTWRGRDTELSAQTIHRSSPSGGGRHPIEGYVWAIDVRGLEQAIYHFDVGAGALKKQADVPAERLDELFPAGAMRFPGSQAIVLLSIVPRRNMYRYREPRTLRTIYMDTAHLASTVELLGKSVGLGVFGHHGLAIDEIERLIGIEDPLTESIVYAVGLRSNQAETLEIAR